LQWLSNPEFQRARKVAPFVLQPETGGKDRDQGDVMTADDMRCAVIGPAPMEDDPATRLAELLEHSLARGDCTTFGIHMENWGNDASVLLELTKQDSLIARRINDANQAVDALRALEREYGEGAALNLDHPFNQKLIRHGHIRPDRVEAAERRRIVL
jgi:hypothetical protein